MSQPETRALIDVLVDLQLVSHARTADYDPTSRGGGDSSPLPAGGIDHRGDKQPSFRQKSALHFSRRLENLVAGLDRLSDERAERIRDEILDQARVALR